MGKWKYKEESPQRKRKTDELTPKLREKFGLDKECRGYPYSIYLRKYNEQNNNKQCQIQWRENPFSIKN